MTAMMPAGSSAPLRQPEGGLPSALPWTPETGSARPASGRNVSLPRGLRVVLIGNSLPRQCGLATFTTDLEHAMHRMPEVRETAIVAMSDPGQDYLYPSKVCQAVRQNRREDYFAAAEFINGKRFDVACLQHEFGIFGGEAGCYILDLLERLDMPVVVTLHTVLDRPTLAQRLVMMRLLAIAARVVVMVAKGREMLIDHYGANPDRIAVIPHGIPDVEWALPATAKARLGYTGWRVILTSGLIGPGKGIETMIEAMPTILATIPDAVYVVMGATHPHLLASGGDAYRESLIALAGALRIAEHVVFLNRFFDQASMLAHIGMCDVYVTPYLEEAQMTSGALALSHGIGRPVVSTPYWHAAELLADGSGRLVPFGDRAALAHCVANLLQDDAARTVLARRAYGASRPTTWANIARRYTHTFQRVCTEAGSARFRRSG